MDLAGSTPVRWGLLAGLLMGVVTGLGAEGDSDTRAQLLELRKQNQILQEQVHHQQELIDNLSHKVSGRDRAGEASDPHPAVAKDADRGAAPLAPGPPLLPAKVSVGAEGGVAFLHSQSGGPYPNSEFRVDEARLFVEAPVWDEVYFHGEINLVTREGPDGNVELGEVYLDFENVSRLWQRERQLNLRVGQFYIPFGEEYTVRYAIDNPLISHSLSDLWGVDEGLEIYGVLGAFQYALAVQNGGIPSLRDYNSDKSVAGRLGWDPVKWLHLSASGMRTGALDVQGDKLSAIWFGNGFFHSLGSTNTTFQADLFEGDVKVRLPRGHLKAAGGLVQYRDNDPTDHHQREVYYYFVEGVHDIARKLYGAVRWSQIRAAEGFPLVGNGDFGKYLFNSGHLTSDLWRLSLGLGYRWSPNLLFKAEYTFEQGRELAGDKRDHADIVAAEVAFKF